MDESYELALAEERAVARVQAMVLRLLKSKGISRTELAKRLGVSPARISQVLGDEPENLSVKKAAALFFALGEKLELTCAGIEELDRLAREREILRASTRSVHWSNTTSNDDWCEAQDDESGDLRPADFCMGSQVELAA